MDIAFLNLPDRVINALKKAGYNDVEQVMVMDEEKLLSIRGMGVVGLNELQGTLNMLRRSMRELGE